MYNSLMAEKVSYAVIMSKLAKWAGSQTLAAPLNERVGTHLSGSIEDLQNARHSLVIDNLLVSIFNGWVILQKKRW
jgi:hypothetical protein